MNNGILDRDEQLIGTQETINKVIESIIQANDTDLNHAYDCVENALCEMKTHNHDADTNDEDTSAVETKKMIKKIIGKYRSLGYTKERAYECLENALNKMKSNIQSENLAI